MVNIHIDWWQQEKRVGEWEEVLDARLITSGWSYEVFGEKNENDHLLACVLDHIHKIMCVFNSYLGYYTTKPLAWCMFSIGLLVYGEPLSHLEYTLVFITSLS